MVIPKSQKFLKDRTGDEKEIIKPALIVKSELLVEDIIIKVSKS